MSDYDYIGNNLKRALDKGEFPHPITVEWLLKVATAQAAYAQVLLLEKMSHTLKRIENRLIDETKTKRAAIAANSPLLKELETLDAPLWMIQSLQTLMKDDFMEFAPQTLDELRAEVRQSNNYSFCGRGEPWRVESGLQRGLRVLLLDAPDPNDFLRLEGYRRHPLWQLLNGLSLPVRTKNVLSRSMKPACFLWWMTPDEFLAELQQKQGGKLAELNNFGKVGLDQVRAALNGAIADS